MKIGASMVTDSLMPRRLMTTRKRMARISKGILNGWAGGREEAEDGVAAGDDGDGDRQHVVDEQGAAGEDAGLLAQGVRGDDVAAAARGEVLDDARVGVGDDEDGQGGGQGQDQGQVGVLAQDLEGLLGTVGGRGQAVGAEPDPGQDGDQGDLVEERRVLDVAGLADERPLDLAADVALIIVHVM